MRRSSGPHDASKVKGTRAAARGLFVTGTDTGVGKTVLASAIAATLARRGERVAVLKPVLTGLADPSAGVHDHELLIMAARSRQGPWEVAPYRFGPPVSPHLAAEIAGVRIAPAALIASARDAARDADVLIVEGVGGLMVPLAGGYLVADLARALGLPLVIAARAGLGTINHTLLTLEAARQRSLHVASVVLTPWPERPDMIERSNRKTLALLGDVEVTILPHLEQVPPTEPIDLPLDAWLGSAAGQQTEARLAA